MYSFDQQIPIFPASFVKENVNAIDFSSLHIIAVASGNTVSLSYMKDFQLHQSYSFICGEHPITALRFDKTNQFLIIGNSRNYIFLYNFHERKFISKPHSRNMNLYIQQIELYENGFIVLYKTGQLTFYTLFEKKDSSTFLLNCSWETKIPEQMTNFAIDSFRPDRLFVYGQNTSYFQIYIIKEVHKPPKPLTGPMEITDEKIQSAKFSIHLKDYLFFVTEDSIMLYNVELQTIIPLSHDQRATSQLADIIQFPTDHSKILVVYKTGSISLLHLQKPFNLFSLHEMNHMEQNQTLISYRLSPLRDDFLILNYDPLGIALFDIYTFRIISVIPFYFDKITSFDTDGTYYVFGTEKGFLISGNAFNVNEKNVYKISPNRRSINENSSFINSMGNNDNINSSTSFLLESTDSIDEYYSTSNDNSVTFVSLNQAKSAIYWATNDGSVGDVNMADKIIKKYHQYQIKSQPNKAIGNSNGALIIQRDPCVLGVFIDGREKLFTSNYRIVDFCFNDVDLNSPAVSTSISGSVMALLETNIAVFFNYSKEDGVSNVLRKMSLEKLMIAQCCAWRDKVFAFGMEDGSVQFVDYTKKVPFASKFMLNGFPVKKVIFCGHAIFALTSDRFLFSINGDKVTKCASNIANFTPFNNYLLMVLTMQSSVFFLKLSDLKRLKQSERTLTIPTLYKFEQHSLLNNPVLIGQNEESNDIKNTKSIEMYVKNSKPKNPIYLPLIWSYKSEYGLPDRNLAYITRTARIFWLFLLDRPCFRYMLRYAESDSKEYDDAICDLISLGNIIETAPVYSANSFLFANKTEESVKVFAKESPKSSTFMYHTILAAAATSFEEDGITEEQCARIRSAGISLITINKVEEGCLLLKLAKLDNVAIEYLLQLKKFKEAMKFIRSSNTITSDEKENACFFMACKMFNEAQPQIRKAMLFFLTAKEYLHALYCLFKLKKYDDAYVIKEYLLKNKLLKKEENEDENDNNIIDIDDNVKIEQKENEMVKLSEGKYNDQFKNRLFGMKLSVDKLCNSIDSMFIENLKKRKCDPAKFGFNIDSGESNGKNNDDDQKTEESK